MRRIFAALVLTTLLTVTAAVAAEGPPRNIDLDRPGAMEALARDNPAHHDKIRQIIAGLFKRADHDVPRWLHVSFGAHDVSYAPVWLTSDPPKKRLSFALDGTRYRTVVTLSHVRGVIVPAD